MDSFEERRTMNRLLVYMNQGERFAEYDEDHKRFIAAQASLPEDASQKEACEVCGLKYWSPKRQEYFYQFIVKDHWYYFKVLREMCDSEMTGIEMVNTLIDENELMRIESVKLRRENKAHKERLKFIDDFVEAHS